MTSRWSTAQFQELVDFVSETMTKLSKENSDLKAENRHLKQCCENERSLRLENEREHQKELKDMKQLLELVNRLSLAQASEETTKNTIEVPQGLLRTLKRVIHVREFDASKISGMQGLDVDTIPDSGLSSSARVSKDDKKR